MILILFSFLLFPIVKNADATSDGILLKHYQFTTLPIKSKNIQNYQYLKEIVILPVSKFNEREALDMINRIGNIDQLILKRLVAAHVQLKLITGKITNEPSFSYLKGIKPRGYSINGPTWDSVPGIGGEKLILARIGYSDKGAGHGSINLELHEIAHSVDRYAFDLIRDDQDFLMIWEKESCILFPNQLYFINYPEEYFAETFAMYYVSQEEREKLARIAPLTAQYLKNLGEKHPISIAQSIFSFAAQ